MTADTIIPANGAPVTDTLFRARRLVGDVWQDRADGQRFDRTSPSHGMMVSQSALCGEVEIEAAIAAARAAFGACSAQSGKARAALLLRMAINMEKAVAFDSATEMRIPA